MPRVGPSRERRSLVRNHLPVRHLAVTLSALLLMLSAGLGFTRAQEATPMASPAAAGVEVVASGLTNPRGFTWGEDGTLYLALAGTGGPDAFEAETASGTPTTYMVGVT